MTFLTGGAYTRIHSIKGLSRKGWPRYKLACDEETLFKRLGKTASNKNDRLYQRTSYKHIHWSNGVQKDPPRFKIDLKRIQQAF